MNYNSHIQTSLKNKSNSLHSGFNFACLHYIKTCIGSIYAPSWQAATRKRGLQAVCASVFSKIHSERKKSAFMFTMPRQLQKSKVAPTYAFPNDRDNSCYCITQ